MIEQDKNEQLSEVLLELERSKERELRLAEENRVILSAISALSHADNKYQIFEELKNVLHRYINFDDFVIAKNAPNSLFSTFLSSNIAFQGKQWINGDKFQRVLEGECIHYEYWVDPVRLIQILFNVIGNAIKFTEAGSVDVHLSAARNKLVIHVEDTGIGIEPERIEHLFSPFIQADSSITRHYGGTGLGLAITKHLVELMKGTISVTSCLGKGSNFTIRLPVNSRQADRNDTNTFEPILKQDSNHQNSQRHILVVEDTKTNQMVIQLLLSRLGYNVTMVSDGEQAVSLTETSHTFDLILMDISMPVMDGIEATKILRCKNIQTPIIALTAHAMQDDHAIFRQAGMNDVVLKPIRSQELQRVIKHHLKPR